ncbi:Fatty-acid-CoA ligase [Actinomortierella wolfii]|nr:Fatty-acid-CoA ligase [Actinomortierella wolfii]
MFAHRLFRKDPSKAAATATLATGRLRSQFVLSSRPGNFARYISTVRQQSTSAAAATASVIPGVYEQQQQLLTHSYVKGDTSVPLCEDTIGVYWDRQIEKFGDRLGLVVKQEKNLHWSYRTFGEKVDALARGLYRAGYRKGDRLGVFMANNSAWATLQYATAKMGIILVTINPAYRTKELFQAMDLVGCKGLVTTPGLKSSNHLAMLLEIMPELASQKANELKIESLPDLRHLIIVDNGVQVPELSSLKSWTRYDDLLDEDKLRTGLAQDPLQAVAPTLSNRDIINLQFTSGTTGLPKGVSLSHRNILNNGIQIGDNMKLTEKDIVCIPVPLFHCFGLVLSSLAAMTHGSAMVFPCEGYNAEATLRAVSEERCTVLHGVPTMFIEEMNHPQLHQFDLSSLRTGIAAGSPVPVATMHDLFDKMNMNEITICYGMTETSPVSFQSRTTDSIEDRCNTVGTIMPHIEAKVIDPATGETLPVGESGEVCTRGYAVMQGGYWKSKKQTDEVIDAEGWMHTGDTGIMDARGYLRIDGRIKDMISRGGEKIHPVEVENCIFEMDGVEVVTVVGVPDARMGEQVCAFVSAKRGYDIDLDSVVKHCKGKISHYKVPSYVIKIDANDIPKTPSGKIQKVILRQRAKEILGL